METQLNFAYYRTIDHIFREVLLSLEAANKKLYDLVFERKIKDGVDIEIVKENLKKFFNNNSESVERLFSKETTILKKNLTKIEVEKYKNVLEASGAQ